MRFFVIAIVDLLSHKSGVASHCFSPTSSKIMLSHIASEVANDAKIYSALVEDCDILCCFFDAHENSPKPNENANPEVLLISSTHPAQLLSQIQSTLHQHSFHKKF